MNATLHGADCEEHGYPFPHRVITSQTINRNRDLIVTETVVCALCGHWIARAVPRCKCAASCHMEARNDERTGETVVVNPETG